MGLFLRLNDLLRIFKGTVHYRLVESNLLRFRIQVSKLKIGSPDFLKVTKCLDVIVTLVIKRVIREK